MTAIACQTGPEDIKNMKDLFLALDKSNCGHIHLSEIEEGFKKMNLQNCDKMIENIKLGDTKGKGHIDYT